MTMLDRQKTIWYHGIQARMIFMLIFTTTLIFGLFMMVYYETTRIKMDTEVSDLSIFFANHLSISMIPALWNYDQIAVNSILDATMNEKQVLALYVKDITGNVMYGKARNDRWDSVSVSRASSFNDFVMNRKDVIRKDETLGSVEVLLTTKFKREKLNDAIVKMLVTLAVLNTLLFLMLFFRINKIIISPIRAVVEYLSRLSVGDIPEQITRKCLNMLIEATNQTTSAAEEIAVGNMDIQIRERSEHDRMMVALVRMIQRLNEILKETDSMIKAVGQGRLDIRGNAQAFEGGWKTLVSGVNQLLDGLSSAVSEKTALNHEMALARRIQTSLLPTLTDDFHPDFEIAATMLPAEQVGGDFYDITYDRAGNLWLAIGDVSGHGVTPGLIMMMAQTVHTTVTTNIDCDARNVVIILNDILYRNVHERLHESHFMTFSALKYLGEGRFQYAGAHLSMIVFRQKTKSCELIRTKGVYLNLKADISRGTKNDEFDLQYGDILVLYTDGLTEAQNKDCKMLDIDGLKNIVVRHANQEPAEMKDMLMADVIQWCNNKRDDDMSVVIIKRK